MMIYGNVYILKHRLIEKQAALMLSIDKKRGGLIVWRDYKDRSR
jgi:hypothetical protein